MVLGCATVKIHVKIKSSLSVIFVIVVITYACISSKMFFGTKGLNTSYKDKIKFN